MSSTAEGSALRRELITTLQESGWGAGPDASLEMGGKQKQAQPIFQGILL